MKSINLTKGKVAIVDDCDYEYLARWKWYAQPIGNTFYFSELKDAIVSRQNAERKFFSHT